MYPDGFHVHNYPSGSRYEGGWKGGRKHGQVCLCLYCASSWCRSACTRAAPPPHQEPKHTHRRICTHPWIQPTTHPQGTYTYAGGGKYVGDFVDDKRHGQGSYTYPDGDVYEGEFRFGRREGRGKYKYSKGECYEVCLSRCGSVCLSVRRT